MAYGSRSFELNKMIAIINYGMGNVYSIQHSLKFLGVDSIYTDDSADILSADKIILPGVGSYFRAMEIFHESNLFNVIQDAVLDKHIPILGICLGMQLMGISSDEDGYSKGFGFYKGDVRRFNSGNIKIPHVGFNLVKKPNTSVLFKEIDSLADFYFTHSFRMLAPEEDVNFKGTCLYGEEFVASFEQGHIFGVQFHPEKSQNNGLRLLKNFIEYQTC